MANPETLSENLLAEGVIKKGYYEVTGITLKEGDVSATMLLEVKPPHKVIWALAKGSEVLVCMGANKIIAVHSAAAALNRLLPQMEQHVAKARTLAGAAREKAKADKDLADAIAKVEAIKAKHGIK